MAEIVQFDRRAVLVRIVSDLDEEQQEQLFFLCRGEVSRRVTKVLELLASPEDSAKISWMDFSFLKKTFEQYGKRRSHCHPDRIGNEKRSVHSFTFLRQGEA